MADNNLLRIDVVHTGGAFTSLFGLHAIMKEITMEHRITISQMGYGIDTSGHEFRIMFCHRSLL